MANPKVRRIMRDLSSEQQASLQRSRDRIAEELPDLEFRDQSRKEAASEPTLSGELRRAIHASTLPLPDLANEAGVTPLMLDEFLTGERTLRSDVLDRLAKCLGLALAPQQ